MKRIEISESDIELFKTMYNQNVPLKDICDKFNISNSTLARWKVKYGVISNRNMYKINANKESIQQYNDTFVQKLYSPLFDDFNGTHKKYSFNETYFDIIDSPNKAYMIGLFLADGNVCQNRDHFIISLQDTDKNILEKISDNLDYTGNLRIKKYNEINPNWHDQYILSLYSKHMCRAMCFYGIIPNKSLSLQFPTMIDKKYHRDILRGYIDGDGTISKTECRVRFCSTNDFCQVAKLLIENTLFINCSIENCANNDITKELRISGKRQCKIFLDWLYNDAELYIDRKYQIYYNKYK